MNQNETQNRATKSGNKPVKGHGYRKGETVTPVFLFKIHVYA